MNQNKIISLKAEIAIIKQIRSLKKAYKTISNKVNKMILKVAIGKGRRKNKNLKFMNQVKVIRNKLSKNWIQMIIKYRRFKKKILMETIPKLKYISALF